VRAAASVEAPVPPLASGNGKAIEAALVAAAAADAAAAVACVPESAA
jgi:hypothetical protein